jgi:hypothetical protein
VTVLVDLVDLLHIDFHRDLFAINVNNSYATWNGKRGVALEILTENPGYNHLNAITVIIADPRALAAAGLRCAALFIVAPADTFASRFASRFAIGIGTQQISQNEEDCGEENRGLICILEHGAEIFLDRS